MSNIKMVIVIRKDLNMRKGKMAAQVGHAVMDFCFSWFQNSTEIICDSRYVENQWKNTGATKIVVGIDSEKELLSLIDVARDAGIKTTVVHDWGLTEFHGKTTLTCAAFGPMHSERLDPITGGLKLL